MKFKEGDKTISDMLVPTCDCSICKDAAIRANHRKEYEILAISSYKDRCKIDVSIGNNMYLWVKISCLNKAGSQLMFSFMDD